MRQLPRLAAVAALTLLAAACGGSDNNNASPGSTTSAATTPPTTPPTTTEAPPTTTTPAPPPTTTASRPAPAEVDIQGFQFKVPASVARGATVKVVNKDSAHHTVTSGMTGKFDTGEVAGNGTGTFKAPATAGRYELVCTYHPNMHGTLVVK